MGVGLWREDGSSSLAPSWSPEDNVDPTDAEPIEPDPVLSVSGGGAIALLLAGNVGAAMLIGGIGFIIVQSIRYVLSSAPVHCLTCSVPTSQSSLCSKAEAQLVTSSKKLWTQGRGYRH